MSGARSDLKVTASDALEFEAIQSEPPARRRGLKLAVWGVVFAVLLGGGWFVFGDMLLRMAAGGDDDMPLIRAAAGPVKVRPENPGGLQVPNRDKLVYERIQSGTTGAGAASVERLLPQPEKPLPKPLPSALAPATPAAAAVGVASQQPRQPLPALPTARVPAVKDVTSVSPPPPPPPPATSVLGSDTSRVASRAGAPLSLKRQPTRAPQPAPAPQPKPAVQAAPASVPPAPAAKSVPAAPVRTAAAPTTRAATARAVPVPAKPAASAGPGSYRVQLAAARTPERAQSEWDRMRRKHLDLLGDLGLTVTKADLGPKKGVFYRLRVGPLANEASARALCKELSKRKMGCLVVKPGR